MKNYASFCTSAHTTKVYNKIDGVLSSLPFHNTLQCIEMELDIVKYHQLYLDVSTQPEVCKIHGIPHQSPLNNARRTNQNLIDYPVHEIVFDLDEVPGPTIDQAKNDYLTLQHIQNDTDNFILQHLPPEFHNASYILRLSSNFLIKAGLRVHLHFLSQEAIYPRDIQNWTVGSKIPVDPRIYVLSQPVFTASPIWDKKTDPLQNFPDLQARVFLIKKHLDLLPENWFPLSASQPKERILDFAKQIPSASQLTGKAGAFCRSMSLASMLIQLGYSEVDSGRWLSPVSTTGVPGLIVFENGYAYSHHNNDPFQQINQNLFNNIRQTLNVYDLARGYAHMNGQDGQSWFTQALKAALENDGTYTANCQNEMLNRTQWLSDQEGYTGLNIPIVDSLLEDMITEFISPLVRKEIFKDIVAKTKKKITLSDIEKEFKRRMKGELPVDILEMSRDADPAQQIEYFVNADILFPTGGSSSNDFFTYRKDSRLWKRKHTTSTDAFVARELHDMLPNKVFFSGKELNELVLPIKKATVDLKPYFRPGSNWGFNGGQYGLDVTTWNDPKWEPDMAVHPLKKTDNTILELPITYNQWLNKIKPNRYLQYLTTTFKDDPASLQLFLEISGYILEGTYGYQRFFIFEGPPGTGKSVAVDILTAMVGEDNRGLMDISMFDYKFGIEHLPDKKLIIVQEPRGISKFSKAAVMEKLLSITGGDQQPVLVKNGKIMQTRLPGKIVLVTNSAPIFEDETGAMRDRMSLLRFENRIRNTPQQIAGLGRLIEKNELQEVVRTAVKKLKQLREQNGFTRPQKSIDAEENIDSMGSPVRHFITKHFDMCPGAAKHEFVSLKEFKNLLTLHLLSVGLEKTVNEITRMAHKKNLQAIDPIIEKISVRYQEGIATGIAPLVYKDKQATLLSLQQ